MALDAVRVENRLDVAQEAHRAVAPGRGNQRARAGARRPAAAGAGAASHRASRGSRRRRAFSPGWKLMKLRMRRSSMRFSSSNWK